MTRSGTTPPQRTTQLTGWQHRGLYFDVRKALKMVPSEFDPSFVAPKLNAADLFSLNTFLGSIIEEQVVQALNELRHIWDPRRKYGTYRFVRQSQTWPDILMKDEASDDTILGVELKGWFALASEGEPSFRYKVSPDKCRPQDILVVYPWVLEQVLAGKPVLLEPFIEEARYSAELRDYYWAVERDTKDGNAQILEAEAARPDSGTRDQYSNHAASDKGSNFGRLARGKNVMVDFVAQTKSKTLCGIEVGAWQLFFKLCAGGKVPRNLSERLQAVAERQGGAFTPGALAILKAELSRALDELFDS